MLKGWKVIAAYLERDERTAMRWAAERGMPVHRIPGQGRGSVHAFREELDAWRRAARRAVSSEPPPAPPVPPAARWRDRRMLILAAVTVALLLTISGAVIHSAFVPDRPKAYRFANQVAQEAYLRASYDWNLRTRDSLMRAIGEFGSTIEHDPGAVPAYVGAANAYLLLREDGAVPDGVAYPGAETAARAALALDPNAAGAHRALAFGAFWWRHDRALARQEFAKALASDPKDPLTHHWLATALSANGEQDAALREIDTAREQEPTATSIIVDQALLRYLAGHRAEGLQSLQRVAVEQPATVGAHRSLADLALWEGRGRAFVTEAMTTARLRGDRAGVDAIAQLQTSDANLITLTLLRDARREVERTGRNWFDVARFSSLANRRADALDALKRACRAGELAQVAAPGDLWLSRTLKPAEIRQICGEGSLIG